MEWFETHFQSHFLPTETLGREAASTYVRPFVVHSHSLRFYSSGEGGLKPPTSTRRHGAAERPSGTWSPRALVAPRAPRPAPRLLMHLRPACFRREARGSNG